VQKAEIYLFAHPDDEFGAFFSLEQAIARGSAVYCMYLTDGGFGGQGTARREDETLRVLSRLGVGEHSVHFIGGREGFADGQLCTRLDDAFQAMAAVLDAIPEIERLHVHAWEGGHQDHDAVHLLGAAYAAKRNLWSACRQFPLYRAGRGLLGISTCAPLVDNGPVESNRIPWGRRLKYLSLCLTYRSQWKSFLFLLPTLALHYALKGTQDSQSVGAPRIGDRPHEGLVLYERRGVESFGAFRDASAPFLAAHFPGLSVQSGDETLTRAR
jgi:LmbE family N-acetylglucosaminyl deacetylase